MSSAEIYIKDLEKRLSEVQAELTAAWAAARGALGVDDGIYEMREGETLAELIEALNDECEAEHLRAEQAERKLEIAREGLRQMREELDAELSGLS